MSLRSRKTYKYRNSWPKYVTEMKITLIPIMFFLVVFCRDVSAMATAVPGLPLDYFRR